jgi:hypothetical protein
LIFRVQVEVEVSVCVTEPNEVDCSKVEVELRSPGSGWVEHRSMLIKRGTPDVVRRISNGEEGRRAELISVFGLR